MNDLPSLTSEKCAFPFRDPEGIQDEKCCGLLPVTVSLNDMLAKQCMQQRKEKKEKKKKSASDDS